jgi:hypothetical protein
MISPISPDEAPPIPIPDDGKSTQASGGSYPTFTDGASSIPLTPFSSP